MRSNLQFAIDMHAHKPDLKKFGAKAALASGQRGFAPHVFLTEAANAEERMADIRKYASAGVDGMIRDDLKANFVAPGFDNENSRFVADVGDIVFKRTLPVETILGAARNDLLRVFSRLDKSSHLTGNEADEPGYNPDDYRVPKIAPRPKPQRPAGKSGPRAGTAPPLARSRPAVLAEDPTPITVVVPDRATPGGQKPVTMRADTRVKGRDGAWTRVKDAMEADGFALDKDWGGFRKPDASDRDLYWYEWKDSGRELDPKLVLKDEPVRWFWPPIEAEKKAKRGGARPG